MMFRGLVILSFAAMCAAGCQKKDSEAMPDKPRELPKPAASGSANPALAGGVPITVDSDGFKPNSVTFKKGDRGTLVFTRTTDDTCATEVVFPDIGIKKSLPKDTPVTIDVPTDKPQTIAFQCGMGMYKSSVVVAPN